MAWLRSVAPLLASAAVTAAVRRLPAPPRAGWQRTNFAGRTVSLSGGLATAAGALAGAAVDPGWRRPALIAATSAMVGGAYDDLYAPRSEHRTDKGLAGHLGALRSGRLSGGAVKVAVIGAGSLLAARSLASSTGREGRWLGDLLNAGLIAGAANLVNLFDLRPGRAAKVALLVGAGATAAGAGSGPIAAVVGAASVTLPDDLGERTMLGDLGANPLGALIGVRLAGTSTPARIAGAALIGGLTLASERVSFTRVIASVPALRWFDELGRSPLSVLPAPPAS